MRATGVIGSTDRPDHEVIVILGIPSPRVYSYVSPPRTLRYLTGDSFLPSRSSPLMGARKGSTSRGDGPRGCPIPNPNPNLPLCPDHAQGIHLERHLERHPGRLSGSTSQGSTSRHIEGFGPPGQRRPRHDWVLDGRVATAKGG